MQIMPDVVVIVLDPSTLNPISITENCTTIFGHDADFLIQRPNLLHEMFQNSKNTTFSRLLEMVQEGSTIKRRIVGGKHASGDALWLELNLLPVFDGDTPDLEQIIVSARDVTSSKQHEIHLSETLDMMHSAFNHLPDGIVVLDENQRIQFMNYEFFSMFSLLAKSNSFSRSHYHRLIEDIEHRVLDSYYFHETLLLLTTPQAPRKSHFELTDGRMIEIDSKLLISENKEAGWVILFRDISEVELLLQRQERLLTFERLQQTISNRFLMCKKPDIVVDELLTQVGNILNVSRAYVFHFQENEQLLDNTHEWCAPGIKPEIDNLKALPFDEMIPSFFPMLREQGLIAPNHIDELSDDLKQILEPQGIQSILHVPLYVKERLQGFIGLDENRQAREWLPEEISIMRNFSDSYGRSKEREHTKYLLIQARDEARQSANLRSQFVSNMSHEFRTPITGIIGMLELLNETDLDHDQEQFVSYALHSTASLRKVLDDILDFSKLEAGNITLETIPTDIVGIAQEVQRTLAPLAQKKQIALNIEVDDNIPSRVLIDPARLRQVLMNLTDNGIKFTHKGAVTIHLNELSSANDRSRIQFAIADTGIGIAEEVLEQIFHSFTQVDSSATRQYGGAGLGLAITQQLLDLMNSELTIESLPEQGSTFQFTLSLPIIKKAASSRQNSKIFEHIHAIIIENDDTFRYILLHQLHQWGIQTHTIELLDNTLDWLEHFDQTHLPNTCLFVRDQNLINPETKMPYPILQAIQKKLSIIFKIDTQDSTTIQDSTIQAIQRPIQQDELYRLLLDAFGETPLQA